VGTGYEAAVLAGRGDTGDELLLDYPDGLPNAPCWFPLRTAFVGLGKEWLVRRLVLRLAPVAPFAEPVVDAVHEILRRHVAAAGKRLRVDQVEGIEVRLDHLAFARATPSGRVSVRPDDGALPFSIPHALGALIATHEAGPALYDAAVLGDHEAEILAVAARVDLRPDASLTAARLGRTAAGLGPWLRDVPRRQRLDVVRRLAEGFPGPLEALRLGWRHGDLLRQWLGDPTGAGDPHAVVDLPSPVSVRIHTTRGGHWPELRDGPLGGAQRPFDEVERDVIEKYARCCAWRDGALDPAGHASATLRARRFVEAAAGGAMTAPEAVALLGGA
jgi:hypothetical protein